MAAVPIYPPVPAMDMLAEIDHRPSVHTSDLFQKKRAAPPSTVRPFFWSRGGSDQLPPSNSLLSIKRQEGDLLPAEKPFCGVPHNAA